MKRQGTWIKWVWILLLIISIGFVTYKIGFYQASYKNWSNEPQPPLPQITIADKKIPVHLGSYCWTREPMLFSINLFSQCVDTASPLEVVQELEPTIVPASSMIKAQPPKNILEFNLTNLTQQTTNPYLIPTQKGKYIFSIDTKWFSQGSANYYFYIEVK